MKKIINGDCLQELPKLIEQGVKVDCVICDIPYGITNNKWDSVIPFEEMWEMLKQIRKERTTPIVLFASNKFATKLELSNEKWFRYKWYWNKEIGTGFLDSAYKPLSNC